RARLGKSWTSSTAAPEQTELSSPGPRLDGRAVQSVNRFRYLPPSSGGAASGNGCRRGRGTAGKETVPDDWLCGLPHTRLELRGRNLQRSLAASHGSAPRGRWLV